LTIRDTVEILVEIVNELKRNETEMLVVSETKKKAKDRPFILKENKPNKKL
jgi:hypothetical protein